MHKNSLYLTLLSCLFSVFCSSQANEISLSGSVIDATNSPVIGAVIQIKGFNEGMLTDGDGKFLIKGIENEIVQIEINYLGYNSFNGTILLSNKGSKPLLFRLEESNTELQEVVISGKSIVKQVKERAYNVSVVDAKKLHNTSLDLGHA